MRGNFATTRGFGVYHEELEEKKKKSVYDFIAKNQPVTERQVINSGLARGIVKKYTSNLLREKKIQKIDIFYVTNPTSDKVLRQIKEHDLVLESVRLRSELLKNSLSSINKISEKIRQDKELSEYISKTIDVTQIVNFEELKQIKLQQELFKKTEDLREQVKIFLDIVPKVQACIPFIRCIVKAMKKYWTIKRVNNDPEVLKALEKLEKCPSCLEDIADWYNLQLIRSKKELPIQMLDKN